MTDILDLLTWDNPVFTAYVVAVAVTVLKVMGQGWMTVWRFQTTGRGLASPEDAAKGLLNLAPDPSQLEHDDYVDRSRRMHRNDLENIPAFWVAGLPFVLINPAPGLAWVLLYGFVAARAGHFWAYATAKSHEIRATFYTIGSLIVIWMAVQVLWVVLT
ncbi:MAPEG family protein [Nioella aestuarii]|uniref:MAPEG family protein n=1 Tax=Nioella aestuarii TaxID=1662864 RepID=UPI003D7FFF48